MGQRSMAKRLYQPIAEQPRAAINGPIMNCVSLRASLHIVRWNVVERIRPFALCRSITIRETKEIYPEHRTLPDRSPPQFIANK